MRNRRRILQIISLVVLIVIALACLTRPSSPSGHYVADSRIGQAGDFYWEFSNGKVTLVTEDAEHPAFGTYARTQEGWVWTDDHVKGISSAFIVECSWWRLRFYDQSGRLVGTMRRRVIPVLRPQWFQSAIPDWVQ